MLDWCKHACRLAGFILSNIIACSVNRLRLRDGQDGGLCSQKWLGCPETTNVSSRKRIQNHQTKTTKSKKRKEN
eukprot:3330913-Amphidinium_carterae.1